MADERKPPQGGSGMQSYRDMSLTDWMPIGAKVTPEQFIAEVGAGSLQRIADSLHRIAMAMEGMQTATAAATKAMEQWKAMAQRLDCENHKLQRQLRRAKKAAG